MCIFIIIFSEGIILSPSLATIELPRILSYIDNYSYITKASKEKPKSKEYWPWNDNLNLNPIRQLGVLSFKKNKFDLPLSYIIICKVLEGKSTQVNTISLPLKKDEYNCNMLRLINTDNTNEVCISFDNELILPEYLVEIQYLSENNPQDESIIFDDVYI